jgi:hypothetical protein
MIYIFLNYLQINKGVRVFNYTWTQNSKKYGLGQTVKFKFSKLQVSAEVLIYFQYDNIAPRLGFKTALPSFLSQQQCKSDIEEMLDFCYWFSVDVTDVSEYQP